MSASPAASSPGKPGHRRKTSGKLSTSPSVLKEDGEAAPEELLGSVGPDPKCRCLGPSRACPLEGFDVSFLAIEAGVGTSKFFSRSGSAKTLGRSSSFSSTTDESSSEKLEEADRAFKAELASIPNLKLSPSAKAASTSKEPTMARGQRSKFDFAIDLSNHEMALFNKSRSDSFEDEVKSPLRSGRSMSDSKSPERISKSRRIISFGPNIYSPSPPPSTKSSPKGILKLRKDDETVRLVKARVNFLDKKIEDTKRLLHDEYALVKKFTDSGSETRQIRLSEDGTEIQLKKGWTVNWRSKITIASIVDLVFGPRTQRFKTYSWKTGRPWLCFSVVTDERTLDLEFFTPEDVKRWYFGLQSLCTLSHKQMPRSKFLWFSVLYRSIQVGLRASVLVDHVWAHFVFQARKKARAVRVSTVAESKEEDDEEKESEHSLEAPKLVRRTSLRERRSLGELSLSTTTGAS